MEEGNGKKEEDWAIITELYTIFAMSVSRGPKVRPLFTATGVRTNITKVLSHCR